MQEVEGPVTGELTIISKRLLRVRASDWESAPGELFERLRGPALEALLKSANAVNDRVQRDACRRLVLLLDCMLRVIGEPPLESTMAFATPRFKTIQELFYGALGSTKFLSIATATRRYWADQFCQVVMRLSEVTQVHHIEHKPYYLTNAPAAMVQAFDEHPLNADEVLRLRPFMLKDKSGVKYNVLLSDMVPVLGRGFTESFYEGLCEIARPKAKNSALRDFGTTFARFIAYRSTLGLKDSPILLSSPEYIQTFLLEFMEYHFMKFTRRQGPAQEGSLPSLQRLWKRYRGYWEQLARRGVMAAPQAAFPVGNPKLTQGRGVAHRKVEETADGNTRVVTQKLLASVPLCMTDEEATQLVFKTLRDEFSTVQSWLRRHLDSFFAEYDAGCHLAEFSDATLLSEALAGMTYQRWKQPTGIALAVRYFKTVHGGYVDTSITHTSVYPHLSARDGPSKGRVGRLLGLPSRNDALALMAFLASTDGRFTDAATSSAVLLDRNGKMVNAVETDGGLVLSVLKERDAGGGWHDITLQSEAAMYIRRWIQVTQPIRDYMRKNDLKGWRNLFIYLGRPLGTPGYFLRSSNNNSAFRAFAQANGRVLGGLVDVVTMPRIRSTRGVLVFLESMDVTAMARELGHTDETSLRHYLPDSLWDYFATRWLRIFQNLLIVAATKDTPYMQQALRFSTVAEMDEFLRNHAVGPIIPEDDSPMTPEASAGLVSEVMVPASPGLFTMLLSISAATEIAESEGLRVAGQAIYWAEFIQRLASFIESDAFHDRDIKRMLRTAQHSMDASIFKELVCA